MIPPAADVMIIPRIHNDAEALRYLRVLTPVNARGIRHRNSSMMNTPVPA